MSYDSDDGNASGLKNDFDMKHNVYFGLIWPWECLPFCIYVLCKAGFRSTLEFSPMRV